MKRITLRLPWPPSINMLWATNSKGNWYTTKLCKDYKELIRYFIFKAKSPKFDDSAALSITLYAYPPDNRKRDLDNLMKVLNDSLQDALVFKDDFQIKRIFLEMYKKDPNGEGFVEITISVIDPEDYKHV